ncbi:MAG: translation elongation factor aEF-2 [Candidatus Micrarchaeota archaeon]|nr:MAG: translation elongation factor aEF-2 [Candidatus Micrarchaeota archaeon]
MARKEHIVEEIVQLMKDPKHIRNVAIVAHVHHGKTTLTDALLVKAGLISKTVAGDVLYTNYEKIEQERRMTIKSANISLGFEFKNEEYIINLIDTPGHVDFGGHVTRSMRAVDGVILVVDPVEMIMPQTETVLRQALQERAKPVLFINKVDRLLTELKLTPEQTQKRLADLIDAVNNLIERYAPPEFASKWKVNVANGSVAIGSAYERWAVSKYILEKNNVTFKEVFKYTQEGNIQKLQEIAPIEDSILAMVIEHLPSPIEAQKYRIERIWHGDLNSDIGKAMINVDPKAPLVMAVFGITYDKQSGEVAVARVFSGTVRKGVEVKISGKDKPQRIQQVGIYMAKDRITVDEVPAGNIAALVGLKDIKIGDTLSEIDVEPFEQIVHYSKPVVTKAFEPKDSRDAAKLIETLVEMSKTDPTMKLEINEETGEYLVMGMGELHLEVIESKVRDEYNIPITTSEPIVVYQETIESKFGPVEGKSPNKHSRFYITVEPLPKSVIEAIENGQVSEGKKISVEKLIKAGLSRDIAKGVVDIYNTNILVDATKGVQYMNEVMESIIEGFENAMKDGPLAREKCYGIMVSIVDAVIHEDPVHRGPAQIIPAIRNPIYAAMLSAGTVLLEPKQIFTITVPQSYTSAVINMLQSKRGQLIEINQDMDLSVIKAKMPVAEVIKGFSNEIRSLTEGRAIWYSEFAGYEKLPTNLQDKIVREIRTRKGQNPEPPKAEDFMS